MPDVTNLLYCKVGLAFIYFNQRNKYFAHYHKVWMDNILVDNLFMFYMRGVTLITRQQILMYSVEMVPFSQIRKHFGCSQSFWLLKRASSCSLNFKCIKLIKPMKSSYCKLGYSSNRKHKEIHMLAICSKCNYPLKTINLGVIIYFFFMGTCVRVRLFVI